MIRSISTMIEVDENGFPNRFNLTSNIPLQLYSEEEVLEYTLRASCGELDAQPSPPDEGVMTFLRKKVKTGAVVGKRVLLQVIMLNFEGWKLDGYQADGRSCVVLKMVLVGQVNEKFEEIRVPNQVCDDDCAVSEFGMIGKKSTDCDENDKLNKLNEKDCVENSSGKLKQDCVDDSNKECLDNNDKLDKEENSEKISCGIDNKLDDEPNNSQCSNNENDEDRIGSKKTYASAIKNSGWFETNKLFVVPTVVTELGDEVVVFDEELVELGSKKWELTLEIIDNGNGKWLFKFSNEIGMVTVANQSPWMVNSKPLMVQKWDSSIGITKVEPTKILVWVKLTELPMEAWTTKGTNAISSSMGRPLIMDTSKGFKETIELQYRDKNMNVKGSKTVKVTNDWKPPICSHCIVFGHDHKNCKVRARTEEEIAAKKLNVDKQVGEQKENKFMQYKGRKHAGNIRTNKAGQTNYYRNNFMSGEGYRRFAGPNKQQWNKKVSNNEGNIDNKNKNQCVEEERLVKINKSQNVTSSTKDPQTSNSFSILIDLEGDNIQGLNMLKDKSIVDKSWEADREKERNERLDEMEGFVEDIEDLYDEDRIVAKNLVADELKSTSSSLLN
ncbi:RNA-directed DNA polymerase, eukaryota, reverse transcriptase zinc-binding domain protein [Tanacetum coccineum]